MSVERVRHSRRKDRTQQAGITHDRLDFDTKVNRADYLITAGIAGYITGFSEATLNMSD